MVKEYLLNATLDVGNGAKNAVSSEAWEELLLTWDSELHILSVILL